MENGQFHKFIILTMILPDAHAVSIGGGNTLARRIKEHMALFDPPFAPISALPTERRTLPQHLCPLANSGLRPGGAAAWRAGYL